MRIGMCSRDAIFFLLHRDALGVECKPTMKTCWKNTQMMFNHFKKIRSFRKRHTQMTNTRNHCDNK